MKGQMTSNCNSEAEQPAGGRDPRERKTLEDALKVACDIADKAASGELVDSETYTLAAGFLVLADDLRAMLDAAKAHRLRCGWCERAGGHPAELPTYTLEEVREHTVKCEHNPLVQKLASATTDRAQLISDLVCADRRYNAQCAKLAELVVALDEALGLADVPERNQDEQWHARRKVLGETCNRHEADCPPGDLAAARSPS